MATKNAADVTQKWADRLSGATDAIRKGIAAVTVSPTQQAAAAADLWQSRVNDPAVKAKFARNASRVTLEQWKSAALDKGVARVAQGAQAAKPKMQSFMQDFLPFVQNVAAQVQSMPKTTAEDRINRMVAQARATAQFKRS